MVYIALLSAAVIAGIDQLLKYLAVNNLSAKTTYPLITVNGKDWLNLTYVENNGAGFSLLSGATLFLVIVTSVIILTLIVLLLVKAVKKPMVIWGFAFIIGGGLGNLIDRLFRGGVVIDYIDLRIINFAVFNFADCFVVIGVIMLFVSLLFCGGVKNEKDNDTVTDIPKTLTENDK